MFIDTHCHLNIMVKKEFDVLLLPENSIEIKSIVDEALQAGVGKIINVGTSLPESINCITLAQHFDNVFAAVGIHPCDCSASWAKDLAQLKKYVIEREKNKIIAIGEIGLDFYHKPFFQQRQKDALKAQIEMALEYNLPISFHVRDAWDEFLRSIESYVREMKGAEIHCFSGDQNFADQVLEWGLYIAIGGPITYPKNSALRDVIKSVPLDRLLLETDAPFLPPQHLRGKQNRPSYIPVFAQAIAELKGVTPTVIEESTTANAQKLFGI